MKQKLFIDALELKIDGKSIYSDDLQQLKGATITDIEAESGLDNIILTIERKDNGKEESQET